jgi:hypothetical protein
MIRATRQEQMVLLDGAHMIYGVRFGCQITTAYADIPENADPVNSTLRGLQRVNPGYVSQLLMAEAIGSGGNSHLSTLATPQGISNDSFSAYAIYDSPSARDPTRLVLLNMSPYLLMNVTSPAPRQHITVDLSAFVGAHGAKLKRMTAPSADEWNATQVTWAGQSWETGEPLGDVQVEDIHDSQVIIQQSEAVLVFLSHGA